MQDNSRGCLHSRSRKLGLNLIHPTQDLDRTIRFYLYRIPDAPFNSTNYQALKILCAKTPNQAYLNRLHCRHDAALP